jgi:uncharacterized protein
VTASGPLALTHDRARRLAVLGQLLSSPRASTIEQVVHDLGEVQMDPTSAVARTEYLVLWSRLGSRFRVADLERLLWKEKRLFEYRAHIVPTSDLPLHRPVMRSFPKGESGRARLIRDWLTANAPFRRYVLNELRRRGPLRTADLEDRATKPWRTGGWNDDARNTSMMLEILWAKGQVMIAGRDGAQRLWDLAERRLPSPAAVTRLAPLDLARELIERDLRAGGVLRPRTFGFGFDGERPSAWDSAFRTLVRKGIALPLAIDGVQGEWWTHADLLDRTFRPRTVLLSPFDDLVSDRVRGRILWDFDFSLEIYLPKAKRRFGYFVMPILSGERLIGRVDPRFDRKDRVLHVNAVYAEPGADPADGPAVSRAIRELARWLGARDVAFEGKRPSVWRRALDA